MLTTMTPARFTLRQSMPPPTIDSVTLASSQQRGQPRGQQRGQSRTDQQQRGDKGNGVAPHCLMVIALPVAGLVTKCPTVIT